LLVITGAYSESAGVPVIRQDIAAYIAERDGHPCDWNNVFVSTGASDAIKVSDATATWSDGLPREYLSRQILITDDEPTGQSHLITF